MAQAAGLVHGRAAHGLVPALPLRRHLDALVSAPQASSVAKPEPRRDSTLAHSPLSEHKYKSDAARRESYQLERQESFESSLERADSYRAVVGTMSNLGVGEPALPE